MYDSLRFEAPFHEEVDNFIEATEKHAATLTDNKDTIICPARIARTRWHLQIRVSSKNI